VTKDQRWPVVIPKSTKQAAEELRRALGCRTLGEAVAEAVLRENERQKGTGGRNGDQAQG